MFKFKVAFQALCLLSMPLAANNALIFTDINPNNTEVMMVQYNGHYYEANIPEHSLMCPCGGTGDFMQ